MFIKSLFHFFCLISFFLLIGIGQSRGEVPLVKENKMVSLSSRMGPNLVKILKDEDSPFAKKKILFQLNKIYFTKVELKGKLWSQIKLDNLNLTSTEGMPELPYHSFFVQGRPEDFQIETDLGPVQTFSQLLLAPAPHMPCRCAEGKIDDLIEYKYLPENLSNYEHKEFYKLQYLGDFQGRPITKVTFFPVQYSWPKKELSIYPKIIYQIENKTTQKTLTYLGLSEILKSKRFESQKILILTPQIFNDSLKEFIDWKKELGFSVDVIFENEYGKTFSEIRQFLATRYQKPETHFDYLLLVGDEDIFPTEYVPTAFDKNTPSDLHYLTYGGQDDLIPDVLAGRLVANSAEKIHNQIQKWMEYEKGNFSDPSGMQRGIGIASNEGQNPSDLEYIKKIEAPFIKNVGTKFFTFYQNNTDSTPANINTVLNSGAMWMTYIGHGSGTSWPSLYQHREYANTHIASLQTTEVRPILIDVSCQNGRFQSDMNNGGLFGERWANSSLGKSPLGATSYYGGSVNISWHPPAIMAMGISQELFDKNIETLGEAIFSGQMYLAKNHDNINEVKDNFTWYHLFGDPTLKIRTTIPKKIMRKKSLEEIQLFEKKSSNSLRPLPKTKAWVSNGTHLGLYLWTDQSGSMVFPYSLEAKRYSVLKKNFSYFTEEISSQTTPKNKD